MQQKQLHARFYYTSRIDERDYSKRAYERKGKLVLFDELISDGCSQQVALRAISCSRATYYRMKNRYQREGLAGLENRSRRPNTPRKPQWSKQLEDRVHQVRRAFPLWGKDKIAVIVKREYGLDARVSTVGRILRKLIERSKIKPVAFYTGKYCPKARDFNDHAQRLPYGLQSKKPGELLQIDHASIKLDSGKQIKHFDAVCPITKISVSKAYRQATSLNAADFLNHLIKQLPFPLVSLQVDGGSEFRGDFEKACKKANIALFVTPARSPETNGAVERRHGTVKQEFYCMYDQGDNLKTINDNLKQYMGIYNNYRPHRGLQGLTPVEYWTNMEVI